MEVSHEVAISKTRRTWFSVTAVVFALIFGIGFFSWIGLVSGWFETGERQIHACTTSGPPASPRES